MHFISIQIYRRASIIQKLVSLNALPYIWVRRLVIVRAMNEIKSAIIGKLLQSVDVSCWFRSSFINCRVRYLLAFLLRPFLLNLRWLLRLNVVSRIFLMELSLRITWIKWNSNVIFRGFCSIGGWKWAYRSWSSRYLIVVLRILPNGWSQLNLALLSAEIFKI